MESLFNLEDAKDIIKRQGYAKILKRYIGLWEKELLEIQKIGEEYPELKSFELSRNKETIKNLKIKLSNYDIYNQKTKCRYCQETKCICYEAGIETSNQGMSKELRENDEKQSALRGETVEEVYRATGNYSGNLRSEKDIELPF